MPVETQFRRVTVVRMCSLGLPQAEHGEGNV